MDRRQDGSEKNYNRHVETLGKINTTEILTMISNVLFIYTYIETRDG